jgi:hypothetical protein
MARQAKTNAIDFAARQGAEKRQQDYQRRATPSRLQCGKERAEGFPIGKYLFTYYNFGSKMRGQRS